MKSVGEAMAIGRTFQESLQKAIRSLETGVDGLVNRIDSKSDEIRENLHRELNHPGPERLWFIADAFRYGMSLAEINEICHIDPWFLAQIEELVWVEQDLRNRDLASIGRDELYNLKRKGFSDSRIGTLVNEPQSVVRDVRHRLGIRPVYKRIDSCAAEFASATAYLYSTYEEECEARVSARQKIIVLGGGPNRIGQGIEFDYCCVHAALALREDGYEAIMVNCNPETVSTDFDISDRLYFEPLTLEDVLEIIHLEQPTGVIVQYGGQTPLKLAAALEAAGAPIIGTPPDSIDLAEDRERFQKLVDRLGLKQPPNATARSVQEAGLKARELGFPLVVRPSYVLGGRAMEIVFDESELERYMREAVDVSNQSPVLLDRFLNNAIEMDVDAICDGHEVLIGGLMEHIELAGVHSGDSACSLPPYSLPLDVQDEVRAQIGLLARTLGVVGLMNAQFAIQNRDIYILEVNPRASRTAPFVSKATGYPLAKIAARCMVGKSLAEQGIRSERVPGFFSVKEAVFPFIKFPGVDTVLGPEMKSTGEVMGVGRSFGEAFAKAQRAAGVDLNRDGKILMSVRSDDKADLAPIARDLIEQGYELVATRGTAKALTDAGISCAVIHKVKEGRPHIVDLIKNEQIKLIINTVEGRHAIADSFIIRRAALQHQVTYTTTLAGARATCKAFSNVGDVAVNRLQDLHREFSHEPK
jgi:carbamoyl-phosphate synthase large subunit